MWQSEDKWEGRLAGEGDLRVWPKVDDSSTGSLLGCYLSTRMFFLLSMERKDRRMRKVKNKVPRCGGLVFCLHAPAAGQVMCVSDSGLTKSLGPGEKMWALMGSEWKRSITWMPTQIPQDWGVVNRDWPGALLQENRGCSLPGLWHADPGAAPAPPAAPALCRPQSQSPGECPPGVGWAKHPGCSARASALCVSHVEGNIFRGFCHTPSSPSFHEVIVTCTPVSIKMWGKCVAKDWLNSSWKFSQFENIPCKSYE